MTENTNQKPDEATVKLNDGLACCPFCGSDAFIQYYDSGRINIQEDCRVECTECYCALGWEQTEEEAIKAWNKRAC